MKPISVRPRKFKVEFEDLGNGKAKIRYEEEGESEVLVEHSLNLFGEMKGAKYGRDGNKIWLEYEGDTKHVLVAIADEIVGQAIENEQDALNMIRDISSNALIGIFSVSEAKAREMVKEPLDLGKCSSKFLEMRVEDLIEEAEKHGADESFSGDVALKSLRQMIKEGAISKDDKLKDALPKIHEYRRRKMGL